MKKLMKVLSLIFAILITASVLVSCGITDNPKVDDDPKDDNTTESNRVVSLQEKIDEGYSVENMAEFIGIESYKDDECVLIFRVGKIKSVFLDYISNPTTARNGTTVSISTGKITEQSVANSVARTMTATEGWEHIPHQTTGKSISVEVSVAGTGGGFSYGLSWIPEHTVYSGSTSVSDEYARTEAFSEAVSSEQIFSYDLSDSTVYEHGKLYAVAMLADISVYQRFSFRSGDTIAKAIDNLIVYSFGENDTYYDIYRIDDINSPVSYEGSLEALLEVPYNAAAYRTLSFETNGGSKIADINRLKNVAISSLPIPTKSGYTFDGWFLDAGLKTKVTFPFILTENTKVYAKWLEVKVDGTIVTTTFIADIWCEDKNVGRETFTVTGIQVRYNGEYYVYGNAWYSGTPGGERFNDVDTIYLKSSDKKILMGGTFHWQSSLNDNNESGVAGFNKNYYYNSASICYMPSDPYKDFAANEETKISITDICVQMGLTATDNLIPEIAKTSFKADLYCEAVNTGLSLTFDVIGIKVRYGNDYYIMGNAFYYGNPGKSRLNDVDSIYLKNITSTNGISSKILFGGTFHWQSSVNDCHECGVAGFDKSYNSAGGIRYMPEDADNDFAANEYTKISITGICVRLGSTDSNANLVPEITTTTFTTSLYCESKYVGSATYSVTGIKVKKDGVYYVYGSASYSGTPGGDRFNDVDTFNLKNTSKAILLGGTMIYNGSVNDWNECWIAGFDPSENFSDKKIKPSNNIKYFVEDPSKDFAANENCRISITGICVAL